METLELGEGLALLGRISRTDRISLAAQMTGFVLYAKHMQEAILEASTDSDDEEVSTDALWAALVVAAVIVEASGVPEEVNRLGVKHLQLYLDVIKSD